VSRTSAVEKVGPKASRDGALMTSLKFPVQTTSPDSEYVVYRTIRTTSEARVRAVVSILPQKLTSSLT
jgi:hypothetical protein